MYIYMQGWYIYAIDPPPTPAIVTIATMKEERVAVYPHVPPPGHKIHVGVQTSPAEDSNPEEE